MLVRRGSAILVADDQVLVAHMKKTVEDMNADCPTAYDEERGMVVPVIAYLQKAASLATSVWVQCPTCGEKHLGRLLHNSPDSVCADCHAAAQPGAFDSTRCVRCPHCGDVRSDDMHELGIYEEGANTVWCEHCGKDYEVETSVEVTWTSPALGVQP